MTRDVKILAVGIDPTRLDALAAPIGAALPGSEFTVAPDASRGIALAREVLPDVVLLDAGTGGEWCSVCRELKADERLGEIPVLLLVAPGAGRDLRAAALEAGVAGFISPPYDDLDLAARIRALASRPAAPEGTAWIGAVFESSLDAILLTVPDGAILAANPAACRMFGRTEAELRALGRGAVVDPGDPRLQSLLDERRRSGKASGELTLLRADGAPFPAELTSVLFRDAAGEVRSSMVVRDLTELRRVEIEYRMLFREMLDGFALHEIVRDARGVPVDYRFLDVNPAFERITGLRGRDIVGRTVLEVLPGTEPQWIETFGRVALTGEPVHFEQLARELGRHFEVTAYRISPGRFACIFADATDRRRAEAERRRVHEEKERLEEQLRQAQKFEAIGRLAGGVAHDFNNLTAIVLGYGEMLLDRLEADDSARRWAEQIVGAGRRAATLTRQLLAFSRKQTLQPEVLDLNALLRNLERMLGRLIGEDVALELRLAADPGRITADPGQIEQVVTNLAVNARDAMPAGGRLTVETADVVQGETGAAERWWIAPGRYVMLALSDTGCGIDTATMARLFEPFFTTKEKGKGTGLGLAMTYGIVKQSGGYIWAESEPGKGTTFRILLPRTDEAVQPAAAAGVESPRGRGERILLVEDESSLRELCGAILERLGYRVTAAGGGPEAVRLVREEGLAPDLVVTDVIMPGMSGAELVERLQGDRPALRVLYMSGYPDHVLAPHGVLAPGVHFIQKPFTELALAVKVREALAGRGAPAAGRIRVLMIDDDEQYRSLVGHFLEKRRMAFSGVDSLAAALEACAARRFDVLLVDLNLPGTDGASILRALRAAGHAAPAIVLTGDVASAEMSRMRLLGVVRVLEKSSRPGPLLGAIEEEAVR